MSEEGEVKQKVDTPQSDKELNFRALEQKLAQEKQARLQAEKARQEAERRAEEARRYTQKDDEEDDDPYIDHKKLAKKLEKFGQQTREITEAEIDKRVNAALEKNKAEEWIQKNSDFYDVMKHAEKLYEADQELAETILRMPDNFDRQKLVYKQIKSMKLHQPHQKEADVQSKIEERRRGPYYQPSGMGTAAYGHSGDFSPAGQKNAYDQMIALKSRLSGGR